MRNSRDLFVSILLFAALSGLAVFLGIRSNTSQRDNSPAQPYSTHSAQDSGAVALALWAEAMGYRTQRIEGLSFDLPGQARVLFIFPNAFAVLGTNFSDGDVQAIMGWTERGNTLIVAADSGFGSTRLGKALKADTRRLSAAATTGEIGQPLSGDWAPRGVVIDTSLGLVMERRDYVGYLRAGDLPVLVSFAQGRGHVWLTSAPNLFVNSSLRNEGNAALVGAMFGDAPYGSLIAFDEFHLGLTTASGNAAGPGLTQLLWNTPAGWAFLYTLLVVLVYLFVNGRRLGRPMPMPQMLVRRRPAEYVIAMAHLFRRARKRNMVMRHYHTWLKRRLGKPYGINPDLPDDEFVAALAHFRERLDTSALLGTLRALAQERGGEKDLVKLAHQAIQFYRPQG